MGESTELGVPIRSSKTRFFWSVYVDDKKGWQKAESLCYMEEIDEVG